MVFPQSFRETPEYSVNVYLCQLMKGCIYAG